MKLNSVTVGGFKNLQRTQIILNTITAIVSPNNYGKSNLLEALDFGIDFIVAGVKDRKNMMRWIKGIPINRTLENENFIFEVEFEDDNLSKYRYVRYGFSFSWYRDNGTGQQITDEWLDARASTSVKYTSYLKRKESKYRKDKSTNSFRKINLDDAQLAIDILNTIEDISIKPIVEMIKSIDYKVCSSLDLRERFQANPIEYIDEENDETISFDDNDVPRALYKLKNSDPEKYNLFLEAVYTLFPEFNDISVQSYSLNKENINAVLFSTENKKQSSADEAIQSIPFKIKDELFRLLITSKNLNQPINITRMSTGTKRLFWLLTNVFIASSKKMSFIGVEELETSIHPRLLKNLLEFLHEVLDETSLIISSHSPFLVQYIKTSNIYIGFPTNDGTAVFKRIKQNRIKQLISLARDNDMSVGEYLFELMSGDKDYESLLSFYLEG